MIHSNKDRAVMLAASNMGAPLDDCRSVAEIVDFMIQGIMEGMLCRWEDRETAAMDCWDDEYKGWLKEIKEYDGKLLPDYWADIDSKLDKMEDRQMKEVTIKFAAEDAARVEYFLSKRYGKDKRASLRSLCLIAIRMEVAAEARLELDKDA